MTTRTVLNEILLPEVAGLLSEGHDVTLMTKGTSMYPFIRGGRDSVVLRKMDSLEVGDIVLAKTDHGQYVLHRIFSIDGDAVTLMGDGNLVGKEHCRVEDVCGTVIEIVKPRHSVTPGKGKIWRALLPVRRYLLGIYRRII